MNNSITVDDFVEEMKNNVENFKEFWLKKQKDTPLHFPEQLREGDWFDQFLLFLDSQ